ncbi:transposon Tf2-1 poly protein [Lipomyces orientalis]|uniref:Transposon Tf2-1 poly protein n=1 Tax=Lipomyces orientalis TaxID=1233043 RepID=A0ACC3TDI6_9ASCO
MRIHKGFHVSLLKKYLASDLPRTPEIPPPPLEIKYEVDEIINSRRTRDYNVEYLVVWLGWNEQGWEPLEHLTHCIDRVREFHTRFPRKPRPNNLDSLLSTSP